MSGAENPMDTSSASGGFGVARFVAQQLLEIVPPKATAASVAVLASRSNMAIEHTRRHLRQLVTRGLVAVTKNGCGPRYYRPQEKNEMPKTKTPVGADVLAMLPRHEFAALPATIKDGDAVWIDGEKTTLVGCSFGDGGWRVDPAVDGLSMWNVDAMRLATDVVGGLTVREIADHFDVDDQVIAPSLSYLFRQKHVWRDGAGGAKDPFRYYVPEGDLTGDLDDVDASAPPTGTSRVDGHAAASGKGVWPIVADQFDPPAGDDAEKTDRLERVARQLADDLDLEVVLRRKLDVINPDAEQLSTAYKIVIDDVHRQRDVAQSDVDTLDAVAVVLARILDGAA